MKIKSKISFTVLLTTLILGAIAIVSMHHGRELSTTLDLNQKATQLSNRSFKLNLFAQDYANNMSERAKIQWFKEHSLLDQELSNLPASKFQLAIHEIKERVKSSYTTFEAITKISEDTNGNAEFLKERRQTQFSFLAVTLQEIDDLCFSLAKDSLLLVKATQARQNRFTLLSVLVLIFLILLISWGVYASVLKSLSTLEKHARELGQGNLNRAIKLNRKDEMGTLAKSMEFMRVNLKKLYDEIEKSRNDLIESNLFLDSIVENIPHMIFVKDAKDLRFVRFNRAGEKLIGIDRKEMLGKNDYDFFPKSEADFFTQKDREVLDSNSIVDIPEEPIHTKTKGTRTLHTLKIPVKDAQGNTLFLLGISEDITDIKKTRDELKETNEILRYMQEETNDGWWDWNLINQDEEYLSPKFKSLFGYSDEEMPNSPSSWQKIINPDDGKVAVELFHKHLESDGKSPYQLEVRYTHKSGKTIWVICRGQAFKNSEGIFTRMVGTHTDITSLKEAEADLRATNKELEQFAYVASHDLQEPLRKIISFGELLAQDLGEQLTEDQQKYMDFMTDASHRMRQLIQDLLSFSRSGTKELEIEAVDCNQLFRTTVDLLQDAIKELNATVTCEELPTLTVSRTLFLQVFQNLISNSLKFAKPDEPPKVEIYAEETDLSWKIHFKDNGIGINPEFHARVFEIFQRLHSRTAYKGTGIGLAICRRIVERHGGTISLISEEGKGTTFIVEMPKP